MQRYNPKDIEPKWQKIWDEQKTYQADLHSDKPKYIGMSMFNYPSGAGIHIGHAMNYTISDVKARFKRQQGYESYHPVGWDAFGLPAENYAIKAGVSPQASMAKIIPSYHMQYKAMGWSNDWSKEIATHQPEYYRWTQWIFSQMYKHGLAYQDSRMQWWCDKDKTVLSNEQVIDGKCWRHDGPDDPLVQQKEVKQWFFKITEYADELLEATDDLDWTEAVKTAQKNWIGKSKGAEIDFAVFEDEISEVLGIDPKRIYTELTARTNWSVFGGMLLDGKKPEEVKDLYEKYAFDADDYNSPTKEAENYFINTDIEAMVPEYRELQDSSGETVFYKNKMREKYNIQASPFIKVFTTRADTLYGATFLVLAPEHESVRVLTTDAQKQTVESYIAETRLKSEVERQAAKEKTGVFTGSYAVNPINNEKIPVWIADYVLTGYGTGAIMAVPAHDERDNEFAKKYDLPIVRVVKNDASDDECSHDEGVMQNSGAYDGVASSAAREMIVNSLAKQDVATEKVNYKMRDWSVSRQRYWGAPIPIVYCKDCGTVPVPDEQLPVVLPELDDFQPSGDGRSALARATDWLHVECPKCGGDAERETDTLDTYICSSWYMMRYLDPHNTDKIFDSSVVNKWMPVDFYNGGDHATAHLLYARFITRFFTKIGIMDNPEPFKTMLYNGKVMASDGSAFSKSKGNGIDPLEIINSGYGADALRTYLMFAAPLEFSARWDTQGVPATHRFLSRVWNLTQEYLESDDKELSPEQQVAIRRVIHPMIKKITEDVEASRYNTAIATAMGATNDLYKLKTTSLGKSPIWQEALEALVACIAPFAPHVADELWQQLGHDTSVHKDSWPTFDTQYLMGDTVTLIVQVNGKMRGKLEIAKDTPEAEAIEAAKSQDSIKAHLQGEPKRVIFVPNKLLNFVI